MVVRKYFGATGSSVALDLWDNETDRVKGHTSNARAIILTLNEIEMKIVEITKIHENDQAFCADKLLSIYQGKVKVILDFIDLYDDFI